jgi:hypothetical protein
MDPVEDVVELVKDLEASLALVRIKAAERLNLTLQKAEVEVNVTTKKSGGGGIKFDIGVSVDASTKVEWSNVHVLTLTLDPKGPSASMGEREMTELAEAIYQLAALHQRMVDLQLTDFNVGNLKLSIAFEKTASGKLQIVAGGGRTSGSSQRVNLAFRPSSPDPAKLAD